MMKRYFRSHKKDDFGGRRRGTAAQEVVVVVFRAVRGARAFVDRFSTLVIQQLFWGTRVYRTSPLKN